MTEEDTFNEDRQRLQNLIHSDRSILLVLERSPPRRFHQAYCDGAPCLWAESLHKSRTEIKDGFRIMVSLIEGQAKYYHVCCLEEILHLPPLAPDRFKLCTSCKQWNNDFPDTYGLLLRDWFESSGQIDLAKFSASIESYLKQRAESQVTEIQREKGDYDNKSKSKGKVKAKSNKNKITKGSDSNSTEAKPVKVPNLQDYKSAGKRTCTLSQVLLHPHSGMFQLWSPRQLEVLE